MFLQKNNSLKKTADFVHKEVEINYGCRVLGGVVLFAYAEKKYKDIARTAKNIV